MSRRISALRARLRRASQMIATAMAMMASPTTVAAVASMIGVQSMTAVSAPLIAVQQAGDNVPGACAPWPLEMTPPAPRICGRTASPPPKLESNPRDYKQPYTLRERIAIEAIDEQVISTPVGTARLDWYRAPGATTAAVVLGHGTATGVEALDLQALAQAVPPPGMTVVLMTQHHRVDGTLKV